MRRRRPSPRGRIHPGVLIRVRVEGGRRETFNGHGSPVGAPWLLH
ncbi:hypothetical protein HMPREF0185_02657 [Brevundimonas diminuta 470-4]|nr:hypothetical protein HMPREF0185_02657 [Brevundimonas diminuta 470-4]